MPSSPTSHLQTHVSGLTVLTHILDETFDPSLIECDQKLIQQLECEKMEIAQEYLQKHYMPTHTAVTFLEFFGLRPGPQNQTAHQLEDQLASKMEHIPSQAPFSAQLSLPFPEYGSLPVGQAYGSPQLAPQIGRISAYKNRSHLAVQVAPSPNPKSAQNALLEDSSTLQAQVESEVTEELERKSGPSTRQFHPEMQTTTLPPCKFTQDKPGDPFRMRVEAATQINHPYPWPHAAAKMALPTHLSLAQIPPLSDLLGLHSEVRVEGSRALGEQDTTDSGQTQPPLSSEGSPTPKISFMEHLQQVEQRIRMASCTQPEVTYCDRRCCNPETPYAYPVKRYGGDLERGPLQKLVKEVTELKTLIGEFAAPPKSSYMSNDRAWWSQLASKHGGAVLLGRPSGNKTSCINTGALDRSNSEPLPKRKQPSSFPLRRGTSTPQREQNFASQPNCDLDRSSQVPKRLKGDLSIEVPVSSLARPSIMIIQKQRVESTWQETLKPPPLVSNPTTRPCSKKAKLGKNSLKTSVLADWSSPVSKIASKEHGNVAPPEIFEPSVSMSTGLKDPSAKTTPQPSNADITLLGTLQDTGASEGISEPLSPERRQLNQRMVVAPPEPPLLNIANKKISEELRSSQLGVSIRTPAEEGAPPVSELLHCTKSASKAHRSEEACCSPQAEDLALTPEQIQISPLPELLRRATAASKARRVGKKKTQMNDAATQTTSLPMKRVAKVHSHSASIASARTATSVPQVAELAALQPLVVEDVAPCCTAMRRNRRVQLRTPESIEFNSIQEKILSSRKLTIPLYPQRVYVSPSMIFSIQQALPFEVDTTVVRQHLEAAKGNSGYAAAKLIDINVDGAVEQETGVWVSYDRLATGSTEA